MTTAHRTVPRLPISLIAVLAGLILGTTPLVACQDVSQRLEEQRNSAIAHAPGAAIDVKTENGAITVQSGPQAEVTIKATVFARVKERIDATRVFAERREDDKLVVYVEWPDGKRKNGEGCDFVITVPDAKGVKATTSNGAIELKGLAGKAVARASNGAVRVSDHNGDVDAKSSNGAITIENAAAAVKAETSNGRITLSLSPLTKGPVQLESSNGAIKVTLPPLFQGKFSVSTSNGAVTIPQGDGVKIDSKSRGRAKFELGSGGPECSVKTSNGAITVSRP